MDDPLTEGLSHENSNSGYSDSHDKVPKEEENETVVVQPDLPGSPPQATSEAKSDSEVPVSSSSAGESPRPPATLKA